VPGFCEQILLDLLRQDKIYITDSNENDDTHLIEGDFDKLIRMPSNQSSLFKSLFSRRKSLSINEQHLPTNAICLLRDSNTTDFAAHCQQNFQNYIMCRIDRLSEGESLLVKIAAIIGNTFSRSFLCHLVDPQSKKLLNINSCILDMMQRTVIECAYQHQQNSPSRIIKCFCRQNLGGFPSQCRLMAFSHVSIRDGIYNSLMENLKRLLTRNAIDYLENQCSILCFTCAPRNDNPFFVQKQDDLTRRMKSHSQHAFIDIVRLAALKDIDNNIKHIIRIRSLNIRTKLRSNTSSNLPTEPNTAPIGVVHRIHDYGSKNIEKRRNSYDTSGFNAVRVRRSLSPFRRFTNSDDNHNNSNNTINEQKTSISSTIDDHHSSQSQDMDKISIKSKNHRFYKVFHRCFQILFCRSTTTIIDQHNNNNNQQQQQQQQQSIEKSPSEKSSHWLKVRRVLISSTNKTFRPCPTDHELLEQPMFDRDLMISISSNLDLLNQQIHLTHTFEQLYEQSNVFSTFQSYVKYKNLIQFVYQMKINEKQPSDIDSNEYLTFNDLRLCQCIDYVLTVYMKLVEYHTNLYDMYEKSTDDKRDFLRRKQFDRISYYRLEICHLLLRLNYLQRLLVEIENGRKFLQKYQNEIINQQQTYYQYQYSLTKYTYNLFEAIVLQRTRSFSQAQILTEQSLNNLNEMKQKLQVPIPPIPKTAKEKRIQFKENKDCSANVSFSSQTSVSAIQIIFLLLICWFVCLFQQTESFSSFVEKYRLEYLICQYHLLQYHLLRHQSIESLHTLIELNYHIYPLTFSLPCTIILIEYFYCQNNLEQCLDLIHNLTTFWWSYLTCREKLELAKLKSLTLIIQLKQSSLESAILDGYFSKRLLTGFHENDFLIETCIHLTLALIGEMRISNIELILQHLEYLSEQTMNCYSKFWYYILIVDVAIELGYELLPITIEFLENLTKYRKKLLTGPNQQSLLTVYGDCTLAQIYIRLGFLNLSKIHFQQALHQIKYDQMHLSMTDFRFKRALIKLIETQLLHCYYTKEYDDSISQHSFLLNSIDQHVNETSIPWNRTRILIYQAYYDRLINDYKRKNNFSIDVRKYKNTFLHF